MLTETMLETVRALFADGKGILAMDESNATCNQRFSQLGIGVTEECRRLWRELIITTPDLHKAIGGVILFDETVHQHQLNGTSFLEILRKAGILFGVKVDHGLRPLALHSSEQITEGLDGLRKRLQTYVALGATFAKWRAVLTIGEQLPSLAAIEANASGLARYAASCQEVGLVPIVEPEVLMVGAHTIAQCQQVTTAFLRAVFLHLDQQGVNLKAIILKPNMILSGSTCPEQADAKEVAEHTLTCLLNTVPDAVPAVAFLSGGQTADQASSRLNAMLLLANQLKSESGQEKKMPWQLAFSFSRAIQFPAMALWSGVAEHKSAAQLAIYQSACDNQLARHGAYTGLHTPAVLPL